MPEDFIQKKCLTYEDFLRQLPGMMDLSCVKRDNTLSEIDEMVALAKSKRVAAVFTLPAFSKYCAEKLSGQKSVKCGGVIGFPSGGDSTAMKVFQAKELIALGCGELDMVVNLTALKSGLDQMVSKDVEAVTRVAGSIPVKAIIEAPVLSQGEIKKICEIAMNSGATFVKSGTGWAGPSTVEHIIAMEEATAGKIKIKAAGGIRDLKTMYEMYQHGCVRFGIGTSAAIKLLEEAEQGIK